MVGQDDSQKYIALPYGHPSVAAKIAEPTYSTISHPTRNGKT